MSSRLVIVKYVHLEMSRHLSMTFCKLTLNKCLVCTERCPTVLSRRHWKFSRISRHRTHQACEGFGLFRFMSYWYIKISRFRTQYQQRTRGAQAPGYRNLKRMQQKTSATTPPCFQIDSPFCLRHRPTRHYGQSLMPNALLSAPNFFFLPVR